MCVALVLIVTSCGSDRSQGKPEESQLLDTVSGKTFYLGMKKKDIDPKKLVKVEEDNGLSVSWETYQYEGVNLIFQNNELIMIHVTDTSKIGRYTTKGLGIGNDESEISTIYGHQPFYNPYFNTYDFIILSQKNGLYYLKSRDELSKGSKDSRIYMISFNVNEKKKIRSFSIMNEKYLAPSSSSS